MDKSSPMHKKPLVNVTCKLGVNGCFKDGRCHALGACENKIETNADRIRAMSDEELAEFLCEFNGCYSDKCPGAELCEFGGGLANGLKKWLKQPAEEGTP